MINSGINKLILVVFNLIIILLLIISIFKGIQITENVRILSYKDIEQIKADYAIVVDNYNNLLDDYASYISWGGDANKIGKKWTYITEEYINKYWNISNQGTQWTQEQNFYQKYANTAPWTWKKRPFGTNSSSTIVLSDWQSFKW